MEDIIAYHKKADEAVAFWVGQARDKGLPVACTNCTKPACCKQRILAYDKEIELLAAVVLNMEQPLRGQILVKLRKWSNDFFRLSREEQLEATTPWKKDMYCPFLVDGKCAVYEHRPLVCRGHVALHETEAECNDPDVTAVRQINATHLHEGPMRSGSETYMMPLAVASMVLPKKIAQKAYAKVHWLKERWNKRIEEAAEKFKNGELTEEEVEEMLRGV